jgi:hypothetical protein
MSRAMNSEEDEDEDDVSCECSLFGHEAFFDISMALGRSEATD